MKRGIVLSGGGARGAYQIGVAKALTEAGLFDGIDAYAGASVGSLNAVLLASGELERAERLWLDVDRDTLFKEERSFIAKLFSEGKNLVYNGYYDTANLRRMLDENIDLKRFADKQVYIAVSHVGTKDCSLLQLLTLNVRNLFDKQGLIRYRLLQEHGEEDIKKILMASCAIPVVFRPVVIGEETYYDGGVLNNAPYQPLIEAGCKEIFLIDLFRMKLHRPRLPDDVTLHIIKPSKGLRGIMDFSAEKIRRRFELGYEDGRSFTKTYAPSGDA